MTIGVGFLCDDGVVLCADNQITWQNQHKYYECKIYPHLTSDWAAYITFAGNPTLMKSFDGKFKDTMAKMPAPVTAARIRDAIETVLAFLDVLDGDQMHLHLLCAIVIPNKEMKLLKTDAKVVSEVAGYDYVGAGDTSALRYLAPILTRGGHFSAKQALNVGVYLVLQAKRYVDGCGGDTNAVILQADGRPRVVTGTHAIEQHLLMLEHVLTRAGTDFFDSRCSEDDFNNSLDRLAKMMRDYRPELMR